MSCEDVTICFLSTPGFLPCANKVLAGRESCQVDEGLIKGAFWRGVRETRAKETVFMNDIDDIMLVQSCIDIHLVVCCANQTARGRIWRPRCQNRF